MFLKKSLRVIFKKIIDEESVIKNSFSVLIAFFSLSFQRFKQRNIDMKWTKYDE